MSSVTDTLAIDGGSRAVTTPRPPYRRFDAAEREALLQVLESENLFRYLREDESQVRVFEQLFARKMGVPYALAVSSGTTALTCGLIGLGIGPGDEVIVPGYTYIASAAAIINARAVPVIAEVDDTLTLDPADVQRKITPWTRAIMPVHMRGTPAQMEELLALAEQHNLLVIEDTAQACGGSYRGRRLGTLGHVGCFSLQHFKIITTGEGGAVVTTNLQVFGRAVMYHDSGRPFWEGYEGEVIPGVGYRMSELAGAMGRAQIGKLDDILARQRAAKARLVAQIRDVPGLQLQRIPDEAGDCGISLAIFLPDAATAHRFAAALRAEGCGAGTMYDSEIPDRHIYYNWDHILAKKGYTPHGCPWTCEHYRGNVQYSKDMCPQTLGYLGRAVAIGLPDGLTEQECDERALAIRKVAQAYLG
ncbi:MAG: aminotransferase class I/II-fold pyridoxal phosphate-dependent enzyme [Armatimonadetes bacterium]|nr:aminotransferase class I/II-fold pyridoxal phosphate-dependent enzyme [Armatimonadota bacterium]